MPVIDLIYDKLATERNMKDIKVKEGVKVSSNFGLTGIKKEKLPGLGDVVVASFEYKAKYEPEIGSIIIEGRAIFHDKDLKKHIKEEKKKVTFNEGAFSEVSNVALRNSVIQALVLSKEMKLPAPMQLPTIQIEKNVNLVAKKK
ncbi:MAG: hypothetical protein ABIG20_03495 [archaeon]